MLPFAGALVNTANVSVGGAALLCGLLTVAWAAVLLLLRDDPDTMLYLVRQAMNAVEVLPPTAAEITPTPVGGDSDRPSTAAV